MIIESIEMSMGLSELGLSNKTALVFSNMMFISILTSGYYKS